MKKLKLIRVMALLLLPLCCGSGWALAQNIQKQQSLKARLEKEMAILDRQIRDNASKNANALSRLSLVKSRVATRQALLDESNRELKGIEGRIVGKQKEINRLQSRLDTMTLYYSRLVRSAYKNRDTRIWYMYILASDNITQGLRRMSFFKNLSSQMTVQARKIKESKEELEQEKKALEVLYNDARKLRNQRAADLEKLKKEEKDVSILSNNLKRQGSKYKKDLAAKRSQAAALEREIKRAIQNAMKGSKTTSGKSRAPIDYKLSDEFVGNMGKLPWPAEGPVTAHFGKQFHSVFKSLQLPMNNGISIAVMPDSQVKAVFDGLVAQITVLPGYHQCILVQHGSYFTLYAKMKNVRVKAGDKVKTGQELGTVDTISGETVFHFEIWDDRTIPQDPEIWLRER